MGLKKRPTKRLLFDKMLGRVARRQKGLQFAISKWIDRVKDPREGEDIGEQLNAFDPTVLEKAEKVIVEAYIYQEMGKIFGLEPSVQDKLMNNLIDKRIPKPILSLTRNLAGPQTDK